MDLSSLETLLELWTDAHEQGYELAVADLCRQRPDLTEELQRRIGEYRQVNDMVRDLERHVVTIDDVRQTVYPPLPRRQAVAETVPTVPGYEILHELGRGGMGVVYLAHDVDLDRFVALKMLLAPLGGAAEAVHSFRQEAETMAQLSHPGTVQIYEIGEVTTARGTTVPYVSMEYCSEGSLQELIDEQPLAAADAASLVAALARTMQVVHEAGIVHRDLKPANVLLSVFSVQCSVFSSDKAQTSAPSGLNTKHQTPNTIPKITDFGLAKRLDDATVTGLILGTPSYMAPEQADARHDVGPTADTWALGAILYECLTTRPPFLGASVLETLLQVTKHDPVAPRQLNPACPHELELIILKCLQKDPGQRYASARDLADDLDRFRHGTPVVAAAPSRITTRCPNGPKA